MTITLKQFAQFMLDFVNKSFTPLLVPSLPEHEKSLEQWRQVSQLLRDIDKVHLWNLENCLKVLPPMSFETKDSKQYKVSENPRPSATNFGSFDNFMEKKDPVRNTFSYQEQPRSISINGKEHSEPRNKSFKYTPSSEDFQPKLSLQSRPSRTDPVPDPQGYDKLIMSFRKLYLNFQNNHKKLLKEDHNLKQNLKVELQQ